MMFQMLFAEEKETTEEPAPQENLAGDRPFIIAVTACPTGICSYFHGS